MTGGIFTDRILLVVEGEGHDGGPSELVQGCVGCSKVTGVDEKLNVRHSEGVQARVLASRAIFSRSAE